MKVILIDKETCPKCGIKFDCGKSGKCWCYEYEVNPSVLEKINDEFDSCLCPDCLKAFSSNPIESKQDK